VTPYKTAAAIIAVLISGSAMSAGETKRQTLCGWFENPTPGNYWLIDRRGEWLIGLQGGYQVKDDWPWPKFESSQWVSTNGNYGYGCACFAGVVDLTEQHFISITSANAKPLSVCREDGALHGKEPSR
jgi:hypothetical protein